MFKFTLFTLQSFAFFLCLVSLSLFQRSFTCSNDENSFKIYFQSTLEEFLRTIRLNSPFVSHVFVFIYFWMRKLLKNLQILLIKRMECEKLSEWEQIQFHRESEAMLNKSVSSATSIALFLNSSVWMNCPLWPWRPSTLELVSILSKRLILLLCSNIFASGRGEFVPLQRKINQIVFNARNCVLSVLIFARFTFELWILIGLSVSFFAFRIQIRSTRPPSPLLSFSKSAQLVNFMCQLSFKTIMMLPGDD